MYTPAKGNPHNIKHAKKNDKMSEKKQEKGGQII